MKEIMLTTKDNPFDPFTDFANWFQFDTIKGYNSCGLLARISNVSDRLSPIDYVEETERAIDEIIKHDAQCIFMKAIREAPNPS